MDLQTRVMEPTGHAGTVIAAGEAGIYVQRDADGQERFYNESDLTPLATRERREQARGRTGISTGGPRAWTMGGRVD